MDRKKEEAKEEAKRKVPVSLVTGFLGSGKTTLLNYILTQNHGKKIAVIENEFGEEIGIESLIARDGNSGEMFEEFFELGNGCICCSVKDDLVNTLERLMEKRHKFDYILIETTGMANPGPVASVFWVDEELDSQLYLDGIITLVDAKNILNGLQTSSGVATESFAQIAFADRILLNKQDLVTPVERQLVEQEIRKINSTACLTWTERSRVDLNSILNIQSYLSSSNTQRINDLLDEMKVYDSSASSSVHSGSVTTLCLTESQPLDLDKLNRWIGSLLWEQMDAKEAETPFVLYRIKGIVQIAGSQQPYLLQGVHDLFECTPTTNAWSQNDDVTHTGNETRHHAKEERCTKIIFIGQGLTTSSIVSAHHLKACIAATPNEGLE